MEEQERKKTVAIVAMGMSCHDYIQNATVKGSKDKIADEVWAINSMGGVIQCDRIFIMDDLVHILPQTADSIREEAKKRLEFLEKEDEHVPLAVLEAWLDRYKGDDPVSKVIKDAVANRKTVAEAYRKAAVDAEDNNTDAMIRIAKNATVPVYSTAAYEEFPMLVKYPLEAVKEKLGAFADWIDTTVSYAIALAITEGFEEIILYGCDFTYPDNHAAEQGHACAVRLVTFANFMGIKVQVARSSTFMAANVNPEARLYGFAPKESIK